MMHWWGNLLFNQARVEADYWSDGTVYVWEHVRSNTRTHTHTFTLSSPLCVPIWVIFVNYHKNKDGRKRNLTEVVCCSMCLASMMQLEWSAVCCGGSSLAAVIRIEPAWYYWRGNRGLETGGGIVGIHASTAPLALQAAVWLTSWPAYLYAKCRRQTRLNNSCV